MICQLFGHKPIQVTANDEQGIHLTYSCTRCNRLQADWSQTSATMDGFRRGLWQAGVAAGGAFAYQLGIADAGMRAVIAATLVAFFLALTGRTVEGKMDERRNSAVVE